MLTQIVIGILVIILIYILLMYVWPSSVTSPLTEASEGRTISHTKLPNSGNANTGYGIWVYVNNWSHKYGYEKTIMKRDDDAVKKGFHLYLDKHQNNLILKVYTNPPGGSTNNHELCKVNNFPLQKWVHVIFTFSGRTLDMYLNGKLVKTKYLQNPPELIGSESPDLSITSSTTFDGYTTRFRYYPETVTPQQAYDEYTRGYGRGGFSDFLGKYNIKVALLSNSVEESSFTL